ncbi:MAG TPA: HigA family addiction module antitoxin [Terriglobales bacterium]|nr:HigA family addiction module antitoxin [Terriglobales bacterium]
MTSKLKPVHPGEILADEFMAPLGLSQNRLAQALHVPVPRIGEILNRRRAISSGTALQLARYFGTTPEFWVNLQSQFDLDTVRRREEASVRREVKPLRASSAHPSA